MIPKTEIKIVVILMVIVISLGLILGDLYNTYKGNCRFVNATIKKTYNNVYSRKVIISDFEKALNFKLIEPEDRMALYSNLSMLYSLEQKYSKMTEAAVNSIYLADKKGEYYYCALNYINLSETFMMLYDYQTAEDLIEKALTYDIFDAEKERNIKEKAYINMAELKAKMGKTKEARKSLRLSSNYVSKSAKDYKEMLLKRKIIWASTFWNEGNYRKAKDVLRCIPPIEEKDDLIVTNIKIPLEEIQAKLEIISGDFKKSEQMCDEVLMLQQEYGYSAESLRFLKEITPLFAETNSELFDKYNMQALKMYSIVMSKNNELTTDYIFSIYGNKYAKYQDKTAKVVIFMIALVVFLFFITLVVLLLLTRKQSITDSLTNVYNRRYFETVYNRYMRSEEKFALIMIDVDYFKNVNDTFGHEFGDNVLSKLCQTFIANKLKKSKLFRMGGEEFCILYKCENLEMAVALAEKLRKSVQDIEWEEDKSVTISVGLAFVGQAEDLYDLADKNLYLSKKLGRNRVTYTN